ncbi:MAG: hypothetical protein NWF14_06575 [Candidatus Bathyarchaeota archaeon]|nr:hypothetical protein [Candidatus Bathyarchaeota archaeon]
MMPVEVVALGINYSQGEKMTYEIDITMKMVGQEFSYPMTYIIEILDKQNGIYTMRTTFSLMNQTHPTATYSITARVNETGHTIEFLDVPPEFQQTMSSFSFMPGNGFYFPTEKAKVGDSWQISIDTQPEEFNLTGTINNEITETRRITVPAGTYDVFKLEVTSSEFTLVVKPPPELSMTESIEIGMTMKGYEYFEKGTCRVIEAKFEQTTNMSMMGQTISITITLDMRLTEHVK